MSHPEGHDAAKNNSNPNMHERKRQRITGMLLVASFLLIIVLMFVIEKVLY
ncbi:MAG: hypothetical protein Q7W56_08535 [Candidatus Latescibacteria bacterium]|nr:hypothetical protein [Candidatus Latescibacterota bacterium]